MSRSGSKQKIKIKLDRIKTLVLTKRSNSLKMTKFNTKYYSKIKVKNVKNLKFWIQILLLLLF